MGDDQMKALLNGGRDQGRSEEAFRPTRQQEEQVLRDLLAANYLRRPTAADLGAVNDQIRRFLVRGNTKVVIPMHENGPVIRSVLETLTTCVPQSSIIVVNDESDDEAIGEVKRHAATLIFRDDLLAILDWERLLPILGLTKIPKGKGVAVLAGYLYLHLLEKLRKQKVNIVWQNDAEIEEFARYLCPEHLFWALLQWQTGARYVKMAKAGRTNERTMCARSMLDVLIKTPSVPEPVRQRADTLFQRLTPMKWMLTGEFLLEWDGLGKRRPFATGYLEETLISMFCGDVLNADQWVQVANENPRIDGANDERKESIMQQMIANFILQMALLTVPTNEWTIDTIRNLNTEIMSTPRRMGWIPSDHEPINGAVVDQDRIIPSITMLEEGGFINYADGEAVLTKANV